jgi:hypothetical protein
MSFRSISERLGMSVGSVQKAKKRQEKLDQESWTPCWPNTTATGWRPKTCRRPDWGNNRGLKLLDAVARSLRPAAKPPNPGY